MAPITRRIFENIRDEHMIRVGRRGDTSTYQSRAEHFVTGAYFDLAHTFHHHELDTLSTSITLSATDPFVALPSDCDVVIAFTLRGAVDEQHILSFVPVRTSSVVAEYNPVSGAPRQCARHGGRLYFDRLPTVAYKSTLYYYKLPTTPDFATGAVSSPRISDLKWLWDEHILELSVARAKGASWLPELASIDQQTMKSFLEQAPEMLLAQALLIEQPSKRGDNQPVGGPLG